MTRRSPGERKGPSNTLRRLIVACDALDGAQSAETITALAQRYGEKEGIVQVVLDMRGERAKARRWTIGRNPGAWLPDEDELLRKALRRSSTALTNEQVERIAERLSSLTVNRERRIVRVAKDVRARVQRAWWLSPRYAA